MSPDASIRLNSTTSLWQFRIGTLMMVTFVAALDAAIVQLSVPVGCLASIPLTLALVRTLSADPRGHRRPVAIFGQSLLMLVGLVSSVLLSVASMVCLITLYLLNMGGTLLVAFFDWSRDIVCRRGWRVTYLFLRLVASLLRHSRSVIAFFQIQASIVCANASRSSRMMMGRLTAKPT